MQGECVNFGHNRFSQFFLEVLLDRVVGNYCKHLLKCAAVPVWQKSSFQCSAQGVDNGRGIKEAILHAERVKESGVH